MCCRKLQWVKTGQRIQTIKSRLKDTYSNGRVMHSKAGFGTYSNVIRQIHRKRSVRNPLLQINNFSEFLVLKYEILFSLFYPSQTPLIY